eukprot:CAMPEP_0119015356 /NCGR_PEP_ID=MMETSP1176-20130426/10891_1 /TAXON_ID=265551 /ORGANISM="Synedropsis recta cf, Strain CCMP1620" /LENGTH=265 /DNA_ID=CAMNT_0006968643 /DNA_START=70 /DNA_END=867 /DNA_ORIENTATION=+
MMRSVCLLALLVGAHGFVAPTKLAFTAPQKATSSLHLMDPQAVGDLISAASSSLSIADVDIPAAVGEVSYSRYSYYTVLGLYVMSFPGIWSQVKRSTSAKIKRKTYVSAGEAATSDDKKDLRQQAGEIMAYMKANNYEVVNAGETITFRGLVQRSTSQAFFLVFCTLLGMASLALVLQIQFQDLTLPGIGQPNWFYLCLLSPYAGVYYWKAGDRIDECEVKLATNDDDTLNEMTIQGSEEELERMWRTLGWQEKGMVKVEGVLDM